MVGEGYGVTAGATVQCVVTRTASQCVITQAARQSVVTRTADNCIGVAIADERVIAAATGNVFNVANYLIAVIAVVFQTVKVKIHLTGLVGEGYGVTASATIN